MSTRGWNSGVTARASSTAWMSCTYVPIGGDGADQSKAAIPMKEKPLADHPLHETVQVGHRAVGALGHGQGLLLAYETPPGLASAPQIQRAGQVGAQVLADRVALTPG